MYHSHLIKCFALPSSGCNKEFFPLLFLLHSPFLHFLSPFFFWFLHLLELNTVRVLGLNLNSDSYFTTCLCYSNRWLWMLISSDWGGTHSRSHPVCWGSMPPLVLVFLFWPELNNTKNDLIWNFLSDRKGSLVRNNPSLNPPAPPKRIQIPGSSSGWYDSPHHIHCCSPWKPQTHLK